MTEKQAERIRLKIKKIRAALAAERKFFGGFYDDSRGQRYLPPRYYIQLADWTGGLTYFRWFLKNFPDDCGFGEFWLEAAIIYYKSGKMDQAEMMAYRTFFSNAYVLDVFFGRPVRDKLSDLGQSHSLEFAERLPYSAGQAGLGDFADWLEECTGSSAFIKVRDDYTNLYQKINALNVSKERSALLKEASELESQYGWV